MLFLNLMIFTIYAAAIIPIHEIGHMVGYRHYGVKSVIGFRSNIRTRGTIMGYCRSLIWADNLIFIEDDKKDAIVSFAGAGASIIFCLCMYIIFPLSALLLVVLYEGIGGWLEVKKGWAGNELIRQGHHDGFWYLESKEEHKIFAEELSRSKYEGLLIPEIKMLIRLIGLDLKEFE